MDWCQDGEEEEVRQVLAAGQADDWGATRALFFACDEPKVLRLLLEHGADPNEAELRWWYKFDCLKILADFGLDVEAKGHISLQYFGCGTHLSDTLLIHAQKLFIQPSRLEVASRSGSGHQ